MYYLTIPTNQPFSVSGPPESPGQDPLPVPAKAQTFSSDTQAAGTLVLHSSFEIVLFTSFCNWFGYWPCGWSRPHPVTTTFRTKNYSNHVKSVGCKLTSRSGAVKWLAGQVIAMLTLLIGMLSVSNKLILLNANEDCVTLNGFFWINVFHNLLIIQHDIVEIWVVDYIPNSNPNTTTGQVGSSSPYEKWFRPFMYCTMSCWNYPVLEKRIDSLLFLHDL